MPKFIAAHTNNSPQDGQYLVDYISTSCDGAIVTIHLRGGGRDSTMVTDKVALREFAKSVIKGLDDLAPPELQVRYSPM